MNVIEYSLRNSKVVWFFLIVLLVGGVWGFKRMGKKEDSTFVIKSAVITVSYPGANPFEVEQLVTEPIEREVQSMRSIDKITSSSTFGSARIVVELEPATPPHDIPQLWDELRRKVLNIRPKLPDGVSEVTVSDDFGDVYGIYYGLSADSGYSWDEMRQTAQHIKTRLLTIEGAEGSALWRAVACGQCLYLGRDTCQFRYTSRDYHLDNKPTKPHCQYGRKDGGCYGD